MKASLRRTLALRFAATMAVGLLLATAAFYWAASRALGGPASTAALEADLLIALGVVVVAGTAATLMGAWHFTSSAVKPVVEITAQATRIATGTLDQRIVAHADTEEYEGLVGVLNGMLERLEQGFTAQRRLVADVSHELRTPLTSLRGQIEVALRAPRSEREYVNVLRSSLEEIDGLTALAEDLLLISRAEAHLLTPHRSATDLEALVDRELERLRRRLEQRELRVTRTFRLGKHAALIDETLVERLVGHLLDNAAEYTPVGGAIGVSVEPVPAGVRLVVENSGSGISADDLPHVFEPFYRADPARTRTNGHGAGLGLALVAAVARLHGGVARASSAPPPGHGIRIEVDLAAPPPTAN